MTDQGMLNFEEIGRGVRLSTANNKKQMCQERGGVVVCAGEARRVLLELEGKRTGRGKRLTAS